MSLSGCEALPRFDIAGDNREERVRIGRDHEGGDSLRVFRVTSLHFCEEVAAFVVELSFVDSESNVWFCTEKDLRCIELVPPGRGLFCDVAEIGADCAPRVHRFAEPDELRMVRVALCLSVEDCLCEQALSPAGQEALAVEVAGVE